MKRFIFFFLASFALLTSFTMPPVVQEDATWEVPKYYMKPVKQDVRAVVIKPMNAITFDYFRYSEPCDGGIESIIRFGPSVNYDREYRISVMWKQGNVTFGTVNYQVCPAGWTYTNLFMWTTSYDCTSQILSYNAYWYVP